MKDPYLLHIFSPTRHVSPFDINMAYEAQFDAVIPHAGVNLDDTAALTQDTIFSRGPKGVRRTALFIGGRDLGLALDMMDVARKAMVPPFEISLLADPSGAITTAAALVALIEHSLQVRAQGVLAGRQVRIFGGTGPVGICAGMLAAHCGACTQLVSHQGLGAGQKIADDYNRRFGLDMSGADGSTPQARERLLADAEIVVNAAKAGVRVLTRTDLAAAPGLRIAVDVNAVPPSGIEGVGVHDDLAPLEGAPDAAAIGALTVGDIKYKLHTRLLQRMYTADKALFLGFREAFDTARELVRE
ncbi:MAG: NAD(P)-dependent methylenetetrahydromethanopterin dehydrogenase [Gammaproteobacteria bacterium]